MKTQSKTQEVKKSLLKTVNTEKVNESMDSDEDEMSLDSDEEVFLHDFINVSFLIFLILCSQK